jgi:hypothetical protein
LQTARLDVHLADEGPQRKGRRRADVRSISLEALARDGGADALRRAAEELEALALELSVSRARD